jgi:hypothetical protein
VRPFRQVQGAIIGHEMKDLTGQVTKSSGICIALGGQILRNRVVQLGYISKLSEYIKLFSIFMTVEYQNFSRLWSVHNPFDDTG